jgi:sugar/nucleoside kinase (ribokinase family)
MAAEDYPFVDDLLRIAPRSILLLSDGQLCQRELALRLILGATITVLNGDEARTLTGADDPKDAIGALREDGCTGIVVTTHQGVEAFLDGQQESISALDLGVPVQTVGAGDCFTGVMIAAWSAGHSIREGLELGQAAAARHVAGLAPLPSLNDLANWSVGQPRVHESTLSVSLFAAAKRPFHAGRVVAAGTSMGIACTLLIAALI